MSHRSLRPTLAVALALALTALALPRAALASNDVRRVGTCSRGSEISVRLRADDGVIKVELELETRRRGATWSVILLHERRIAFRGKLRARGDSVRLRRSVPDWFGVDTFVVRASGPRAESCRVSASI